MPCPTCDHSLDGVGHGLFHCPRCGTLVTAEGTAYVPSLIRRCRAFEVQAVRPQGGPLCTPGVADLWTRLGIAEAINRPGDRP